MSKQFTLAELSKLTKAKLIGDPDLCIGNVDNLESANSQDASFLSNPRYREVMKSSQAGVICIDDATTVVDGKNFLVSENPSRTFQFIAELLLSLKQKTGFLGVHASAVIHESAKIGNNVQIGPNVVVDKDVTIGDNTQIFASVSVGASVQIGTDCIIYPSVVIREQCVLGNRVILQPGAIIGSCGFGFIPTSEGTLKKLDQLGNVVIEDDVEVGSNTTIDRARFKSTRIGKGSKIDNLVQIAHNVILGENNIVISQAGIAGSVKMGKNVFLGGQTGVIGHVEIADGVQVATRGGVSKSIKKQGRYNGSPAVPIADYNKNQVHLRKMTVYVKKIKELEMRLKELESH